MWSKQRTPRTATIVSTLIALAVGACGDSSSRPSDAEATSQALTSASQTTAQASLLTAMFADLDPTKTAEELAAEANGSNFDPPDCATVTSDGATATWSLTNCTGTYGFAAVSGTITATYRVQRNEVVVAVHTTDLQVNGAAVSFDATAVYTNQVNLEKLEVQTTATAQTLRVGELSWQGNYTAVWSPTGSCLNLDGSWEARFGREAARVTVTELHACSGACPDGTITYDGPANSYVLELSDGTVSWSRNRTRVGSLDMTCTAASDWAAQ